MCLVQKMKSCVSKSLMFMNYNNVINWFFLPFLIVVLMLRTVGAYPKFNRQNYFS